MKDDLDLNQFKDLIGDVGGDDHAFSLDDILREDYSRPQTASAPTEDPVPESADELSDGLQETETLDAETEPIPEEQPTEPELPQEEESTEIEPETWEESEDEIEGESEEDEAEEVDFEEEIRAEEEDADDEESEKNGLFDRMIHHLAEEDADEEAEEEPEERFEEKKPKRRFWERWLASEPVEEDDAPEAEEELQGTQYVKSIEEHLEQTAQETTEEDEPTEETAADVSEEEETVAEEPEEETISLPKVKKPEFLSKWFEPIAEEEDSDEAEAPEETEGSAEADEEPAAEETAPVETAGEAVQPQETAPEEETAPVLSETEFETFMQEQEADDGSELLSFEQLMQESGVDMEKEEPALRVGAVVHKEEEQMVEHFFEFDPSKTKTAKQPAPQVENAEEPEVHVNPYHARKFPKPEWLGMSLERISEIAPKTVRFNSEPVLMNEVRRLEQEREQARLRQEAAMRAAQPQPEVPEVPRTVLPSEKEESADGGDDEVSGGPSAVTEATPVDHETPAAPVTEEAEETPKQEPETTDQQEKISAAEAAISTDSKTADRKKTMAREEEAPPAEEERPKAAKKPQSVPETDREDASKPVRSAYTEWQQRKERLRISRETPKDAKVGQKQWNRRARSIGRRSIAVFLLTLLSVYLTCSATMALPVPQQISYGAAPQMFYGMLIGMQVLAFLIAWDVIADACRAAVRLQTNFSTLVVLAGLASIAHSAERLYSVSEEISYPCVVMAALFFLMRARMAQALARRNTYKSASVNQTPIGVYIHRGETPHLIKRRLDSNDAFVYSAAKDGWHSMYERLYTPIAVVVSLVLAVLVSFAAKDLERFPYVLSAMLTASCQIGVLTAVAYGCANVTRRLGRDHAAMAGLSAAVRIARAPQAAMTEEDLFPAGSIVVDDYIDIRNAMRVDDVLAYAAALEGDTALGRVLKERMRRIYADSVAAHEIIRYTNGSQGRIGQKEVLFGTAELMNDHKIPIPALPNETDHMFLAVNGKTAAIFEVRYQAVTQVYTALQILSERKISILLKNGDCYLTDDQLCDLFGLKPGMIHRAGIEQSHAMGETAYTRKDDLIAILTRDGAAPYVDCADAACSLSRLTSLGMLIGVVAAVIDLILMAYLCFVFAPLGASPLRVLIYSILWAIPVFFIENEAKQG